ncbi:dihydrofolate reductase family protein [Sphingobacterium oryzagri]|uniref:Dihydrofolate reductase family protein n=1 Tax=Sphingobacterium oryzagri TaxID=3025669 RepID=A0ABY7WJ50_9SPHI|nr:dihydrofolate reductase family protein [Sphingobacterium sp. KACC 22765]WDF69636.1 dihydrofolate reductase family protein [Sphingobacterium sp. KACC 22765]
MKKVILDLAVTLDGFIEGTNGEIDWCIMDDDMDFPGFLTTIDTIFYGRISYDAWGNFRPEGEVAEGDIQFWNSIHAHKKYVFSSQKRDDDRATFISSNVAEQVAQIKQQDGKDIWLYGGASLIQSFIEWNLVDRYRIAVHPIVLGSGKPLFANLKQRLQLNLVTTNVFRSGVVQLIYEPASR